MQLDAPGAEIEHARRLADRILRQVEADERDQLSARALRVGERAVVAGPEARMPVRLVEAEHVAAGESVLLHAADQVVVDADHAVDVRPEMRVRVEDVGALGKLLTKLGVPLRHQFLGTLQRVVHVLESMYGGPPKAAWAGRSLRQTRPKVPFVRRRRPWRPLSPM